MKKLIIKKIKIDLMLLMDLLKVDDSRI